MNDLQQLLGTLGSQKLKAGYLTPLGPTALETCIALKRQFDPIVILGAPITPPALLMTPAFVGSLASGQDAIFLNDVSGNLDLSHAKGPAFIFDSASAGGGGGGGGGTTPVSFNAGITTAGSVVSTFSGITAVQITLPKSGLLQSLSAWTNAVGGNLRIGLYSDLAGAPKSLLASSAIGASTAGLLTLAVTGGPTLPAGTYWLAGLAQTNFDCHTENTGGVGAFNSSQAWNAGVMPDPFPTYTAGPFQFGYYGTFFG